MDLIIPAPLSVKYTIAASGDSLYPTWQAGDYYQNDYVYDDVDGHDYRAKRRIGFLDSAQSVRPSEASIYDWEDLGPSPGKVNGYVSNAPLSFYEQWDVPDAGEGAITITRGTRVWSAFSRREYEALQEIELTQLSLRPEVLITHPESSERAKWVDIGPMNVVRCLDPRSGIRTEGPDPLTMTLQATGTCDRIAIFGAQGVKSVQVSIANSSAGVPSTSLQIGSSDVYRSSAIFAHLPVTDPEYAITLSGGATANPLYNMSSAAAPVQVGSIVVGKAIDCGPTETNLNNALVTPRLVEDDFGNVSRTQKWFSKRIQGVLRPLGRNSDLVMTVLGNSLNSPIVVDFSRGALNESAPLVYGFLVQASQRVTGLKDADAIDVIIRGYSQ